MYEIMENSIDSLRSSSLKSLSLFVGSYECNAKCGHCAGVPLRKYAPREDGIIDEELISRTLKDCYKQGARSLSISSSGEPTLSPLAVTKVFSLIGNIRKEGIEYSPINLYSNGIRIGEDKQFCDKYLSSWKNQGLTTVYITVHNTDEKENAKIYGVKSYPNLDLVISRIHDANLLIRANIVLSKENIGTSEKFRSMVGSLIDKGVDKISAWSIRDENDEMNPELSPLEEEMDRMESFVSNGELKSKVRLLREKDRVVYDNAQKLTLFPNGDLSNSWCK